MNDLQAIKEEIANLGTRMDNVEGYFNNFDTTLTNHMTDYKTTQEGIDHKVRNIEGKLNWAFWVIFGLLVASIGGLIALATLVVNWAVGG